MTRSGPYVHRWVMICVVAAAANASGQTAPPPEPVPEQGVPAPGPPPPGSGSASSGSTADTEPSVFEPQPIQPPPVPEAHEGQTAPLLEPPEAEATGPESIVTAPRRGVFLVATTGEVNRSQALVTPDGVVLRADTREFKRWLCEAPCRRRLDPSSLYTIDGPLIVRSRNFEILSDGGAQHIDVRPGSFPGRVASAVITSIGVAATLVAIGLYVDAQRRDDVYQNQPWAVPGDFDPSFSGRERTYGTGLAIAGAVTAVGGIVGIILTRTAVRISPMSTTTSFRPVPGGAALNPSLVLRPRATRRNR